MADGYVDRAQTLWTALVEIFGQTLITNFGAEPPPMWRAKVDELTDAQLQRGLKAMSERDSAFAPTLGQFVAACKGDGERRAPLLPSPAAVPMDGWAASLNQLLLPKLLRVGGVHPDVLAEALAFKARVAQQLRDMYPGAEPGAQENRELTAGISREFDRILAGDRKPETADELEDWMHLPSGMSRPVYQQAERRLKAARGEA